MSLTPSSPMSAVAVLTVAGEVDMTTAPRLMSALTDQLMRRPELLVVDLSKVTFLSAAGLGSLAAAAQDGIGRGVVLTLVASTRPVRRILHLAALDRQMPVDNTCIAALLRPTRGAGSQADNRPRERTPSRREGTGSVDVGIVDLQDLLLDTLDLKEFLDNVAATVARELGSDISCGVTVRVDHSRVATLGVSDRVAATLDEAQYSQDRGPCLHAMDTGNIVEVPDIAADQRWPEFAKAAAGHGVTAVLSTPLHTEAAGTVGALNTYSRGRRDFDHAQLTRFAQHAAGAVAIGVGLTQRPKLTDNLRAALSSRTTVDHAIGIVMGQRRCTAGDALAVLGYLAEVDGVKPLDVAEQIIFTVSGDAVRVSSRG